MLLDYIVILAAIIVFCKTIKKVSVSPPVKYQDGTVSLVNQDHKKNDTLSFPFMVRFLSQRF